MMGFCGRSSPFSVTCQTRTYPVVEDVIEKANFVKTSEFVNAWE
jgi:hypothetical protein